MPSWYPSDYTTQPYYPRTLKISDLAPSHIAGQRLAFWRKCRGYGLAMWKDAISFRVGEFGAGYLPGFITLDIVQTQDGTAGQADFGRLPPDSSIPAPGVAWAHFDPEWFEQQFLSNVTANMKRVIAHEVGHTLGFGHGGTGVMSPDPQANVNAEEIDAAQAYWRTAG